MLVTLHPAEEELKSSSVASTGRRTWHHVVTTISKTFSALLKIMHIHCAHCDFVHIAFCFCLACIYTSKPWNVSYTVIVTITCVASIDCICWHGGWNFHVESNSIKQLNQAMIESLSFLYMHLIIVTDLYGIKGSNHRDSSIQKHIGQ